jgi:hypothetical protein
MEVITSDADGCMGRAPKSGIVAESWQQALGSFLKMRRSGEKPPGFEDGPFRRLATSVILHMQNLTHSAGWMHQSLLKCGASMKDYMEQDMDLAEAEMGKYSRGHAKKFKIWKESLGEDCGVEVLKERYNLVLCKCNGPFIKTTGKVIEEAVGTLEAHVTLVKELSPGDGESMWVQLKKKAAKAHATLAQGQASKLEYWVCNLFFSSKEKQDKRDQILHYSNHFDAYQFAGGRDVWIHKQVRALEKEMTSYGGPGTETQNGAAAAPPKKKGRAA